MNHGVATVLSLLVAGLMLPAAAYSQVIEFDDDKKGWLAAVGEFTTVGFACCGEWVIITDHYQDCGVLFTDGDDHVPSFDTFSFPIEGWGLRSTPTPIEIAFATPQYWIGADFPGTNYIKLFHQGELFFVSHSLGGSGIGKFGGLVSEIPFDYAIIFDLNSDLMLIDDLHFGPPPGPGDVNGDGVVNAVDLIQIILSWGVCPEAGFCPADTNHDDLVGVEDMITVILNWS